MLHDMITYHDIWSGLVVTTEISRNFDYHKPCLDNMHKGLFMIKKAKLQINTNLYINLLYKTGQDLLDMQ